MNEELFNEATKSNVLTKKLIDQLLESMTYSSISFINWTIETLSLIKARSAARRPDYRRSQRRGLYLILFPAVCGEEFLFLHSKPGV